MLVISFTYIEWNSFQATVLVSIKYDYALDTLPKIHTGYKKEKKTNIIQRERERESHFIKTNLCGKENGQTTFVHMSTLEPHNIILQLLKLLKLCKYATDT
jgi:gluconate kinase